MKKIVIIGGGAAGMATAIMLKDRRPDVKVVIVDKNKELGRKLRATGNGACNITNIHAVGVDEALDFFDDIGISVEADEDGWCYPFSREAVAVAEVMIDQIKTLGIEVINEKAVMSIKKLDGKFEVDIEGENIVCDAVVIAAGGKAAPQFGTIGDSYRLAKSLGHTTTRLAPGLTGIEFETDFNLFGVRSDVGVQLLKRGEVIAEEWGRAQFTDYGASGICVMNLSSFVDLSPGTKFSDYSLKFDLLPELTREDLVSLLTDKIMRTGKSVAESLITLVNKALIPVMVDGLEVLDAYEDHLDRRIEEVEESFEEGISELQFKAIDVVADRLKGWEVTVSGTQGWNTAQVTRGGIKREEIIDATNESRIVENLYFAGEVLDYDGPCGGYNLQNAWLTALHVAEALAEKL